MTTQRPTQKELDSMSEKELFERLLTDPPHAVHYRTAIFKLRGSRDNGIKSEMNERHGLFAEPDIPATAEKMLFISINVPEGKPPFGVACTESFEEAFLSSGKLIQLKQMQVEPEQYFWADTGPSNHWKKTFRLEVTRIYPNK